MNIATLYKQVASLGFETSLEYNDAFFFAANRAIYQVNLLRPHTAECEIIHRKEKNLLKTGFETYERESELTFEADGARAYYFEAAGSGTLYLEKYDAGKWTLIGEKALASAEFTPYRGFIKADGRFTEARVRLRFAASESGDYIYYVRNVAMYGKTRSAEEKDIPTHCAWTAYDVAAMRSDFLSLASPPIIMPENLRFGAGYQVENGRRILLPYDAEGDYRVLYHRKPCEIPQDLEPSENMEEIDLDEELCTLLPLLTAAYVWADDEPEKASYYMNLYRERAAELEAKRKTYTTARIINVNGW